jgi:uncharacterized membrane protein
MSAPVKASPLDVDAAAEVVAAAVVDGPSAGAMAGVLLMGTLGVVQPV